MNNLILKLELSGNGGEIKRSKDWFPETANRGMHLQKHYLNTNKTNISTTF
jgi:hypothetical protein